MSMVGKLDGTNHKILVIDDDLAIRVLLQAVLKRMRFDVELADPAHLESVLNLIRHLDAVYDVYRILPGKKD